MSMVLNPTARRLIIAALADVARRGQPIPVTIPADKPGEPARIVDFPTRDLGELAAIIGQFDEVVLKA